MAVSEAMKAIVLIIPVTILILILVTESWIEPLFYLMNIGTPVLINYRAYCCCSWRADRNSM